MISKHGLKKGPRTELSWDLGPFLGSAHLLSADCTWQPPTATATAGRERQAFGGSRPTDLHRTACAADMPSTYQALRCSSARTRPIPASVSDTPTLLPGTRMEPCALPPGPSDENALPHLHTWTHPSPGHLQPAVGTNYRTISNPRSNQSHTKSTAGRELLGRGCALY